MIINFYQENIFHNFIASKCLEDTAVQLHSLWEGGSTKYKENTHKQNTHTHTHLHTQTHAQKHLYTQTHTHTHKQTHTYKLT